MKIITNIATTIEHGPYGIGKQEFLNVKMKFRMLFPDLPSIDAVLAAGEFLTENTNLNENEIDELSLFLLRKDFRIEE